VLLALERQERAGSGTLSAVQEVRQQYQIPVVAVVNLADLIDHVAGSGQAADIAGLRLYRERYGLPD
jgi:orotate phosphoribosyltransferase